MPFVVAPLSLVKKEFPEFRQAMADVESRIRKVAEATWPGFEFGGLLPKEQQYGLANIRPRHVFTEAAATGVARALGSNSWVQTFTGPGSQVSIFSYTPTRDLIHAFAGFAFPDPHILFNDLQLIIGDITFPIIEIEEARLYAATGGSGGFAVILKPDKDEEFVARERVNVNFRAFQERNTSGLRQRVIPIGLAAYRDRTLYLTEGAN